MKILQFSQYFPPNCTFGAENYAFHLCHELSKNHEVMVITSAKDNHGERYETEEYSGITIQRNYNLQRTHPYESNAVEKWTTDIIEDFNPDIAHIHHLAGLSSNIPYLLAEKNVPAVYTLHDYWYLCSNYHLLKENRTLCLPTEPHDCVDCDLHTNNLLDKNAKRLGKSSCNKEKKEFYSKRLSDFTEPLKKAEILYAPSRHIGNIYHSANIPAARIKYSPYGMDHSKFPILKKKQNTPLTFGFIGSISPHKGVDILIKAFNELKKENVQLFIFGSAGINHQNYMKELKDFSSNNNVHFGTHLANDQINKFFSKIDMLLVPSIWHENAPLVISEAFMTKTPVLCSNYGGMAEMVKDKINGLHFKRNNAIDLANKILSIINNRSALEEFTFQSVRTIKDDSLEKESDYNNILLKKESHRKESKRKETQFILK